MKKIILLLIFVCSCSFAQVSSRTAIFKLPQWIDGNKLSAGTESDSSQSNNGLNNGFYRLETILSKSIDTSGYLKQVYGIGSGSLLINSNTHHTAYVQVDDSLYVGYNLTVENSATFGGNIAVSGYVVADSFRTSGGKMYVDGDFSNTGDITTYGSIIGSGVTTEIVGANLTLGRLEVNSGSITFYRIQGAESVTLAADTSMSDNRIIYLPDANGTLGTVNGNQDFTSIASQTFTERSGTPSNPTSGTEARLYMKGDKLIIQFNDGGTVRYKYLDLTGTGVTWTHTTSAP